MATHSSAHLHSQAKDIVFNVSEYFAKEKEYGGFLCDIKKANRRTAEATNVGEGTVERIRKEARKNKENGSTQFMSPKKRKRSSPATDFFDDFHKDVLRKTIFSYYERKEIPTIEKIFEDMKNNLSLTGSRETLRRVMNTIGFRFSKVDGRRFLMERDDVTSARYKFLREMRTVISSGKNIVYLDETWINQNHTVPKCWLDITSEKAGGVRVPTGKGGRWIILHAGTKNGFVPECALFFQAKNVGDYHDQMDADKFEKWFQKQLLPNIPPSSIIVMDNASYHSRKIHKPPTSSNNKAIIKQWLERKGIEVPDGLMKVELMDLVTRHITAADTNYVIDKIASDHGHKVVRLPPYHCHYNPIELIWAQLKGFVAKRNTFKIADLKMLIQDAIDSITVENWRNVVEHTEKLQADDARRDVAVDQFIDSFIINLTSSDEEDSS